MHTLNDVPTPCVLIDETRMESNLTQMAAQTQTINLRPHTKTHKSVELAKRQLAHGAHGITVAKVSEAEKFVLNGLKDVRIAYPLVGIPQLERVAKLSRKARVSFCIDSEEGAERASNVFREAETTIDVLLEIDTGYGRCGVAYDHEDVVHLARIIQQLEGLRLCGILTHEGNAYTHTHSQRIAVMTQTRDRMLTTAVRLKEANCIDPESFEISMGSTPSIHVFEQQTKNGFQITELRPGNYIFHDLTQVSLGVCSLDACALTVLTTVVSRHRTQRGTEHFMLDAGRKILTSDPVPNGSDFGCILYNPRTRVAHPHARITGLSEEHGWGEVLGGSTFNIGDQIQIVPNHACVVVNMVDQMYLIHGSTVSSKVTVDARGCVT